MFQLKNEFSKGKSEEVKSHKLIKKYDSWDCWDVLSKYIFELLIYKTE